MDTHIPKQTEADRIRMYNLGVYQFNIFYWSPFFKIIFKVEKFTVKEVQQMLQRAKSNQEEALAIVLRIDKKYKKEAEDSYKEAALTTYRVERLLRKMKGELSII